MTLTSAIEAVKAKHRACMDDLVETILAHRDNCLTRPQATQYVHKHYFAALPEPMTEDEITLILDRYIYSRENIRAAIRNLKSHNVLFVKE